MRRRQNGPLHGVMNVFKPSGVTSRDVVNHLQRLVRPAKVGHAGTLDPLADGVLVVCIGAATRLIRFVQQMPKTYQASFLLGQSSDTDDIEGDIRANPGPLPSRDALECILPKFVGEIQQRPPAFSAIKVKGQRAYALARRGEHVELEPREVRVDRIALTAWKPPAFDLEIHCGSGVYVRSIGRDIGKMLGCGAVMSQLRRSAIGAFVDSNATPLDKLSGPDEIQDQMLPIGSAAAGLLRICLDSDQLARLGHGQTVEASLPAELAAEMEFCIHDESGHLRAIGRLASDGKVAAAINLPASDQIG